MGSIMEKKVKIALIIILIVVGGISGVLVLFLFQTGQPSRFTLKWIFKTGAMIYYTSPAIDGDYIYIADNHKWFADRDGYVLSDHYYLYKLYKSNGTLIWKYDCGPREIRGGPAIGDNHLIYIVGEEHNATGYRKRDILYAINPDGTLNWSRVIVSDIPALYNGTYPSEKQMNWPIGLFNMAIDKQGNVYVAGNYFSSFYGNNGTLRWNVSTTAPSLTAPLIFNDTVYFVERTYNFGRIVAYTLDGTWKWSVGNETHPFNYQLSCDDNGNLYGGGKNVVHKVSPDGKMIWTCHLGGDAGDVRGNIAVDSDGTLFLGTKNDENSKLFAIYPNGTIKWKYASPLRDVYSSPAIGTDGNIYFASEDRKIFAINKRDGTLNSTFYLTDDVTWSSVIIDNNMVYIGDMSGRLYALEVKGLSLATTPWPCLGRNAYRNYRF